MIDVHLIRKVGRLSGFPYVCEFVCMWLIFLVVFFIYINTFYIGLATVCGGGYVWGSIGQGEERKHMLRKFRFWFQELAAALAPFVVYATTWVFRYFQHAHFVPLVGVGKERCTSGGP